MVEKLKKTGIILKLSDDDQLEAQGALTALATWQPYLFEHSQELIDTLRRLRREEYKKMYSCLLDEMQSQDGRWLLTHIDHFNEVVQHDPATIYSEMRQQYFYVEELFPYRLTYPFHPDRMTVGDVGILCRWLIDREKADPEVIAWAKRQYEEQTETGQRLMSEAAHHWNSKY